MKYSISESARIAGITRKTLYKHIDKKPISTERDENGSPIIDASELIRVYGDKCKFSAAGDTETAISNKQMDTGVSTKMDSSLEQKINHLEELRETDQKFSREKMQLLEDQIDLLKEALSKSQEAQIKTVALLEDKTGKGNDWHKAIDSLNKRIDDQDNEKEALRKQNEELLKLIKEREEKEEQRRKEQEEKEQAEKERQKKREEEFEASQTWVSKMFGSGKKKA